ncbi:MAG TPA: helix-turn-helix transcriptional regulator [Devosiaceae bacterium]|jgi:AraC-like DNA-binding protein
MPADLSELHDLRLAAIESANAPLFAIVTDYPANYRVALHRHSRSQLLHAASGVVLVVTTTGRWLVPSGQALWIPAGLDHTVEMLGAGVRMYSVYVADGALTTPPGAVRVLGLADLTRALIIEAAAPASPTVRSRLVMALLLEEIPALPELPLGLPLPAEARLAALCRRFIASPDPHLTIDDWADSLAMSRRAFTRAFRRETGLSLSTWRQQACLFTAMPRLARGEAVTTVAFDLGYDSVAAFTTMFRRMLGAPPRAYFGLGG